MDFSPCWNISDGWHPMHCHDVLYVKDARWLLATVRKNNGE
jgi:hypothetical protein